MCPKSPPQKAVSLVVAETHGAGAAAFQPNSCDVNFLSHDDITEERTRVDVAAVAEIFVGLGRGQVDALRTIVRMLIELPAAAPDVFVEISPGGESDDSDDSDLFGLFGTVHELRIARRNASMSAPRLRLHAARPADEGQVFDLARRCAETVRAGLGTTSAGLETGAGDAPASHQTASPGLPQMETERLSDSPVCQIRRHDQQRRRLTRQRARIGQQRKRLAEQRRTISQQGLQLCAQEQALQAVSGRPRVSEWQRLLGGSVLGRLRPRLSGRPRLFAVASLCSLLLAGAAAFGWFELGVFGVTLGVLVLASCLLTCLLLTEVAALRGDSARNSGLVFNVGQEHQRTRTRLDSQVSDALKDLRTARIELESLASRIGQRPDQAQQVDRSAVETIGSDVGARLIEFERSFLSATVDAAHAATNGVLPHLTAIQQALETQAVALDSLRSADSYSTDLQKLEARLLPAIEAASRAATNAELGHLSALQRALESRTAPSADQSAAQPAVCESNIDLLISALRDFEQRANTARQHQTAQLEAAVNLFSMVPTSGCVPPMGGWAASPDLVRFLLRDMLRRKPRIVVECGSGVSTLWFALLARHLDLDTRIVALEHDERFREATMQSLNDHGLGKFAEVRHAPIVPISGLDTVGWYDVAVTQDLDEIGLLFVDGPPAALGALARYPAVPVLKDKLAADCLIVLDDMVRQDEKETAAQWQLDLPDFTYELINLDKGAGTFRRSSDHS